jgi:hypothetical protein
MGSNALREKILKPKTHYRGRLEMVCTANIVYSIYLRELLLKCSRTHSRYRPILLYYVAEFTTFGHKLLIFDPYQS